MGDLHRVGGSSRWDLTVTAAKRAVLLSLLFIVVYGSTNWFTAQRSDVRSWYFPWELDLIPFVPLFIFPYMSIDFFFFGAPFLCSDKREIDVFTRRVVFSIVIAATFFLVLPLRLVWIRPHVEGWLGEFVESSCNVPFLMAYPHNLFPSLHIALRTILADTYARHTRGLVRVASNIWFSLIGFSTMLTYQHHLVDIGGGFVLAAFAFYLFPENRRQLPVVPNFRIAWYYAASALAVLILAVAVWPWGAFLLWPAASFGIIAAGYCGLGPGIYRKSDGRLPLNSRFVHAVVLCGQYLSLIYYRRQCRAWDEAAPGVWIGRALTDTEAAAAIRQGVTAVLDLTAEFSEAAPLRTVNYRNLPVLDLTRPTLEQMREAVQFITEQSAHGTVYVHCKIGYSRSAAIVGAYLLASRRAANADEAVQLLRQIRPTIIVRPEASAALREFESDRWVTNSHHGGAQVAEKEL